MSEATDNTTMDEKARKQRYKQSLNLPRTPFPMKADLARQEPRSQERWQSIDLYTRVMSARHDDPEPFLFHDGPPYANGAIHTGHLLNKVLKDLVVRTRNLAGRRCPYIPGWDCHGLPIEHKVVTELAEAGKMARLDDLPEDQRRMAIRRECARYAQKYKELQARGLQRLHTLADYDHPYLTMEPAYEQAVLEVFADLVDQGLVYRDLKPVHWSVANLTALAEAELEYHEREDPSIYVWFDAEEPSRVLAAFSLDAASSEPPPPVSFMIWTTTPWTLPANLLIAVHPDFDYSLVRLGDRHGVVAAKLLEDAARLGRKNTEKVETLATVKGSKLVGLRYRHPLVAPSPRNANAFRVVAADHVTLEDGTGLVHTAPGHGAEDYHTGLREGVEIYCPVRGDGTYDDTVPAWLRGKDIWQANEKIIEALRGSGHLYHDRRFVHSYPHDWRSKTPVIFRATQQWFIAVDRPLRDSGTSLRQAALEATERDVRFVPDWGRSRLQGMLKARPDWCISRQRSWGLPIPAFALPDGTLFLTSELVRAVARVVGQAGSDAWFTQDAAKLLSGWDPAADPAAPAPLRSGQLAVSDLKKGYDIFDVWFESGSSWNGCMRRMGAGYPTDLYLEGSDQHRGWFQHSLLPALGATGVSPFRTLLTHGFIVDKDGRKMSKSLGNALEVEDLLKDFGADVCRWWVSSLAFENDIKLDREFFELAGESYRKVRNTLRFLLGNLGDFSPQGAADLDSLPATSLDRYALERAAELRRRVLRAYEDYDFRQAHLLLFDFCNDTLSAFYLDAVKDRLYCDPPDSPRRRATQTAMHEIALLLCSLLAPILPHTADEAYRALLGAEDDETTLHTGRFHELDATADPGWARVMEVRQQVQKAVEQAKERGIENRLDAGVVIPDRDSSLAPFLADLADVFGVSRVILRAQPGTLEVVDLREQPRCERSWRRDETVLQRSDGGWLSERDARAVGL